ncbi:hypothetical protein VTJ04DRAFT_10716 [Mycothermus thermophilus]|uniref:uncharacterized protein n=1 Tax=Humicola insolens TaxID=85995 RepID=UPI0037442919
MEQPANVFSLPIELWHIIGSYLPFKDFANVARTCKALRKLLIGLVWRDRHVCFAGHYLAVCNALNAFIAAHRLGDNLPGIGPYVRHASILVLYDEPASESDGLGWVDAPCCLDYGKGPYKPNLTRAIGEVLDLMANLEELHLDIKQCVTPLPDFFFSDLLTLNYPRRKQYLQLKHLRVLGSALCRTTGATNSIHRHKEANHSGRQYSCSLPGANACKSSNDWPWFWPQTFC